MKLRISLLADVQRPSTDQFIPLKRAVEMTNSRKPDLVIFCGDLVDNPRAEDEYLSVLPIINSLVSPVHYVLGNHDVDPLSPDPIALFQKYTQAPGRYYSVNQAGYHLIFLDTTYIKGGEVLHYGQVSAEQLNWLERDLSDLDDQTPILVFSHNPLDEQDGFGVINANQVFDLIQTRNILGCFSAHKHYTESKVVNGIPVVVTGPLSFGLSGQKTLGFSWLEVAEPNLDYEWIPVADAKET